jgi:hypothetical protein
MSHVLHHLSMLGWTWVGLFLFLDVVAIGCAVLATLGMQRGPRFWALAVSAVMTLASLCVTLVAVTTGVEAANSAVGAGTGSSQAAQELAGGISVAMEGALLGIGFTLVAGAATLICLVASLMRKRPKSQV